MEVLLESARPATAGVLTIRTGDASTTATDLNLAAAHHARVYVDHTLVVFNSAGSVLAFMRPGTFWSFLWQ